MNFVEDQLGKATFTMQEMYNPGTDIDKQLKKVVADTIKATAEKIKAEANGGGEICNLFSVEQCPENQECWKCIADILISQTKSREFLA